MKRKGTYIPVFILLMVILSGCGGIPQTDYNNLSNDKEMLEKENAELKKRISKLETELEELKFGADKLLKEAESFFSSKDYTLAKIRLNTLLEKHPSTPEASKAKELLPKIEEEIRKQQEEKELAEKKALEEEKKRLDQALKNMRKEYDEVREITWYYDKTTPEYANENNIFLYIGQDKNKNVWLRFKIQYAADNWLFIDKYIFKVDDKTYALTPSYDDIKRDNNVNGIWEVYDTDPNLEMIQAIIESEKTILRHQNDRDNVYEDRTISKKEKTALRNVLDAYKALGGR